MREFFISELLKHATSKNNIILVTGDLGFGVLDNFMNTLPNQFINAGVAEQNMTGMSAGLALEGFNVFTYSIGNFPTLRCLEQIRNDIIYHNLSVNIISVGGGLSYGALGMSHHAIEDISIMRTLPEIKVFSPCDKVEVKFILKNMINNPHPTYIRIDKFKNNIECKTPIKIGTLRQIKKGKKIAILGYGSILEEAILASNILSKKNGIEISIYSIHTIKPINVKNFINILNKYETVITLEEHVKTGGIGSLISEIFFDHKLIPKNFLKLSLPNKYSKFIGNRDYLRKKYKLDSYSILKHLKNFI